VLVMSALALAALLLAVPLFVGGAGPPGTTPPVNTPQVAGDLAVLRAGARYFPARPTMLLARASLDAGERRRLRVAGTGAGVPGQGVTAVALNLEVVADTSAATVALSAAGTAPAAGEVTVAAGAGRTVSAFTVERLSQAGELDIRAAGGPVTLTVRLRGFYAAPCGGAGGTWRPVEPAVLLDRTLGPNASAAVPITIADQGGRPTLEAVTLAVEASEAQGSGRLQVSQASGSAPDDATLAFAPGREASVLEVARPGPDGRITVANLGAAPVRARLRLLGYHTSAAGGSPYQEHPPSALLDTTVRAGSPLPLSTAGRGGLPGTRDMAAPDLAVVATGATGAATLTLGGKRDGQPAATMRLYPGEPAAARAIPRPDPDGRVWISVTSGSARVRVWAHGWFGSASALTAAADARTARIFDRRGETRAGWTGGSGSAPVRLPDGSTAWLFSEAFLGVLRRDGSLPPRTPGPPRGKGPLSTLVDNAIVVQDGEVLTTHVGPVDRATGFPAALLRPPAGEGRRYWPSTGLVEDGILRVLVHEFQQQPAGGFAWTGSNRLISLQLPDLAVVADTPLAGRDDDIEVQWGAAILQEADHTYVYGTQDVQGVGTRVHVARFPRGQSTGPWQFWNGTGWVADPAASAPLAGSAATDPIASIPGTVARLGAGYVMLTIAPLGTTIDARTSCAPTGPWTPARPMYTIPELHPARRQGDQAFLARGYPSGDGLLVAYSLAPNDLSELLRSASYYRPRYVRVH
jgi:hypothetical protein